MLDVNCSSVDFVYRQTVNTSVGGDEGPYINKPVPYLFYLIIRMLNCIFFLSGQILKNRFVFFPLLEKISFP